MAALTRSAVRSRIAEAITQALGSAGPAGWRESRYHADLIGSDPRSVVHLSFAISIGASTPAALDRQRRDVGAVATTTVTVRWVHRMRGDAQVADYDEALDAGEALVAAVLAVDKDPGLSVSLVRIGQHQAVGDGTYLRQDVEFSVLHRLALAA